MIVQAGGKLEQAAADGVALTFSALFLFAALSVSAALAETCGGIWFFPAVAGLTALCLTGFLLPRFPAAPFGVFFLIAAAVFLLSPPPSAPWALPIRAESAAVLAFCLGRLLRAELAGYQAATGSVFRLPAIFAGAFLGALPLTGLLPPVDGIYLGVLLAGAWLTLLIRTQVRLRFAVPLLILAAALGWKVAAPGVRATEPVPVPPDTAPDASIRLYNHTLLAAAECGRVPRTFRWIVSSELGRTPSSLEVLIHQVCRVTGVKRASVPLDSAFAAEPQVKSEKAPEEKSQRHDFIYLHVLPDPKHDFQSNFYYTEDFFRRMKLVLAPDGIIAAVLPAAVSPQFEAATVAALRAAFRQVAVLDCGGRIVFAGDGGQLTADPEELDRRATEAGIYGYFAAPDHLLAYSLPGQQAEESRARLLDASLRAGANRMNRPVFAARTMKTLADWYYAAAAILLAGYFSLRYWISWQGVHKKIFRSAENGFFLQGMLLAAFFFCMRITGEPSAVLFPRLTAWTCLAMFAVLALRRGKNAFSLPVAALLPLGLLVWLWVKPDAVSRAAAVVLLTLAVCGARNAGDALTDAARPVDPAPLAGGALAGILAANLLFPLGFLRDERLTFPAVLLAVQLILLAGMRLFRKKTAQPLEKLPNMENITAK